jgi:hypothetical protein
MPNIPQMIADNQVSLNNSGLNFDDEDAESENVSQMID